MAVSISQPRKKWNQHFKGENNCKIWTDFQGSKKYVRMNYVRIVLKTPLDNQCFSSWPEKDVYIWITERSWDINERPPWSESDHQNDSKRALGSNGERFVNIWIERNWKGVFCAHGVCKTFTPDFILFLHTPNVPHCFQANFIVFEIFDALLLQ